MSAAIDIDVDITASHEGHELRIQGDRNGIVVNAGSWSPILKARRLQAGLKPRLPGVTPPDLSMVIKVRNSTVCTIRSSKAGASRTIHPLGIIRTFFSRG